MITFHS